MTKIWTIGAVLLMAGAVMATEDNPLLAEKPVEPAWADYDAATLRIVASRMWQRIQTLEAENAELREKLETERNSNRRLRDGMRSMQRPVAPVPQVGGGSGAQATTPSVSQPPQIIDNSWRRTPASSMERARQVKQGMSLAQVRQIMGADGQELTSGNYGWRIYDQAKDEYIGLLRVRFRNDHALEVQGAKP